MSKEYCGVCDGNCANPAGYGISGGGHCSNADGPRYNPDRDLGI